MGFREEWRALFGFSKLDTSTQFHTSQLQAVRTRESPGLEGEGHLCTCHAGLVQSSGCSHPGAREREAQCLDMGSKLISTLLALHNDPTAFRSLSALGTHSTILC